MHVIICGGRETHLSVQDYAWLGTMHREEAFTLVITGGAPRGYRRAQVGLRRRH